MKFSNFLILEDTSCSTSECDGGTTTCAGQESKCSTLKNDANFLVCVDNATRASKWFCKKKVKKVEPDPVKPDPVTPAGECPENQADFVKYIWILNNWVDPTGSQNPDNLKHQTKACGINSSKVALTCDFAKASTMKCGDGMKAIWKEKKEDYNTWKKNQENVVQTTTTTTVKPIDPEVQKFRNEFDVEFFPIVDQLGLTPDQWGRMHNTMPDINPPTSYRVLQQITTKIVDYIGKFYRSKEFGLFVEILDTFIELYGDKTDSEGNVTKNSVIKPEFFTNFGGTIEEVKALSQSIKTKNSEMKKDTNFDSLSDPETELRYLFQEVVVTVLEEPQNYFTKPLQMRAFRYTKSELIDNIDLSPINEVLSGVVDSQNCLKVLDVDGKYSSNPQVPENLKLRIRRMGQKCLCANFYKDLGKLSIKDKFDKEKRNLAKRRLASLNSMGIYMSKC